MYNINEQLHHQKARGLNPACTHVIFGVFILENLGVRC